MKTPLLSVIVPVYNAADSVGTIISRVLNQSMRNLEIIAVNDGSRDDSLKILQQLQKKDRRIQIVSQANAGASSARNAGIEKAKGKYIMFLDADDDIAEDMISFMVDRIEEKRVDLVVCGIKFITHRHDKVVSSVDMGVTAVPKRKINENWETYVVRLLGMDGRLYNPSNKIFRANIIKKHGVRFQSGLDFGEDLTFNLHYIKHARGVDFIYKPFYIYNFNTETGTFGKSSLVYENRQKNYRELQQFIGDKHDSRMDDLAGWINFFWFYSFALAVCSSQITLRRRFSLLKKAIRMSQLKRAETPEHIGKKKYLIERIIFIISRSTFTLWLCMLLPAFMKNNRVFAKLWRRMATSLTPSK